MIYLYGMITTVGTDIQEAARLLQAGELVAIPTETVYGLAGNALDSNAVARIFEAKQRPRFNPLIIHGASWEALQPYLQDVPPLAHQLAQRFMPGPLTLLLPKSRLVPDLVTAGSELVAVRVPQHPLCLQLLHAIDFPLAAPSANPFGYVSPTTAEHVLQGLDGRIAYVLDGGASPVGIESTILGFEEAHSVIVHRLGGLSVEAIQAVLTMPVTFRKHPHLPLPAAPGQLASHYAPRKPLYVGEVRLLRDQFVDQRIGILSFQERYDDMPNAMVLVLASDGKLTTAAAGLFAALRQLDASTVDVILAEHFPPDGLGAAINDRLRRAQQAFKSEQ
jgi:L-threonylcarbamoyladenylate synthase